MTGNTTSDNEDFNMEDDVEGFLNLNPENYSREAGDEDAWFADGNEDGDDEDAEEAQDKILLLSMVINGYGVPLTTTTTLISSSAEEVRVLNILRDLLIDDKLMNLH